MNETAIKTKEKEMKKKIEGKTTCGVCSITDYTDGSMTIKTTRKYESVKRHYNELILIDRIFTNDNRPIQDVAQAVCKYYGADRIEKICLEILPYTNKDSIMIDGFVSFKIIPILKLALKFATK